MQAICIVCFQFFKIVQNKGVGFDELKKNSPILSLRPPPNPTHPSPSPFITTSSLFIFLWRVAEVVAVLFLPVGWVGPVLRKWIVEPLHPGVVLWLAINSLAYSSDCRFNFKHQSFHLFFIHARFNFANTGLHASMRRFVDRVSIFTRVFMAIFALIIYNIRVKLVEKNEFKKNCEF